MKQPTLNRMYETFIKLDIQPDDFYQSIFHLIRTKVHVTIKQLQNRCKIDWFSFLIHDRQSGVPTTDDDNNAYFHIRFSLSKEVNEEETLTSLPDFCEMTRKVNPVSITSIVASNNLKYNPSLRKHGKIEEVGEL